MKVDLPPLDKNTTKNYRHDIERTKRRKLRKMAKRIKSVTHKPKGSTFADIWPKDE